MKPTVGRIVLYALPKESPRAGEVRPAIVTRVVDEERCNLSVFLDGPNDPAGNGWAGTVARDDSGKPGTWRWPPREGVAPAPKAEPAKA